MQATPLLCWLGAHDPALVAALSSAGLQVVGADKANEACAVVVNAPAADADATFQLPRLQELRFKQPASRLIILDRAWDRRHEREVPTTPGMTGVPKPVGPPSRGDPWQINDYARAKWVMQTQFLVRRLFTCRLRATLAWSFAKLTRCAVAGGIRVGQAGQRLRHGGLILGVTGAHGTCTTGA